MLSKSFIKIGKADRAVLSKGLFSGLSGNFKIALPYISSVYVAKL